MRLFGLTELSPIHQHNFHLFSPITHSFWYMSIRLWCNWVKIHLADMSCHSRTWCHQSLGCWEGLCLSLWPYDSWDLNWCLWLPLPLKVMWMSEDLALHLGSVGVWEPCCHWRHSDLCGLHCHTGLWYCPFPGCCTRPCLALCPSGCQGLGWYLWLLWAQKTVRMPGICIATWDHVHVWKPCCCQGHNDPGGLCCHQGHGNTQSWAAAKSHVWGNIFNVYLSSCVQEWLKCDVYFNLDIA